MATEPTRRLFTIDDYQLMGEAGILTEDDRVELLNGEIIQMTAIGSRHAAVVKRLNRIFAVSLGPRAVIGVQDPVILDDLSEPQPDLSICAPRDDDYASGHPRPADIHLLIEVADASLRFDRQQKLPRYAATGVPETWLVDLTRNVVDVHRSASPSGYADVTTHSTGTIAPIRFPDATVAVEHILR